MKNIYILLFIDKQLNRVNKLNIKIISLILYKLLVE